MPKEATFIPEELGKCELLFLISIFILEYSTIG